MKYIVKESKPWLNVEKQIDQSALKVLNCTQLFHVGIIIPLVSEHSQPRKVSECLHAYWSKSREQHTLVCPDRRKGGLWNVSALCLVFKPRFRDIYQEL